MKKISRLIQLLPNCRLEDFPTHIKGDLAAGILSNWSAAWHPLLISAAQSAPVVFGADLTSFNESEEDGDSDITSFETDSEQPTQDFDPEFWKDSLIFVPEVSLENIAEGFAANVVRANAKLVTGMIDRSEIIKRCFELTELAPALEGSSAQSPDRVQQFYSLAYAYLQIQLLTRKIRYSSNLDQNAFDQKLVEAANAFADEDSSTCDSAITACYDLLLEEKNNYYPVQPTLIDLVLTTPKTLGARFDSELDSDHIVNFLMTGETLSAAHQATLEKLKAKVSDGKSAVIGGNEAELPDTLLSPETTLRQLKLGLGKLTSALDYDVSIFMRRRFGLMSSLPNILDQLNFSGAMHTSLDGGKFPTGSFGTIRWAGDAEASILSKAETLLDASDPATMLDLGVKIGRQIDSAHEATCTFAHWPSRCHQSYTDLIGVAARSTVLGEFQTLDDHFETLYDPGYADNFSSEEYAAPFLIEALQSSSEVTLSRFIDYWRQIYSLLVIECLIAQWCSWLVKERKENIQQIIQPWTDKCEVLWGRIESLTKDWNQNAELVGAIDEELTTTRDQALAEFSQSVSNSDLSDAQQTSVVNPLFFTRRARVAFTANDARDGFQQLSNPFSVQQINKGNLNSVIECRGSSITPIQVAADLKPLKKQASVLEDTKLQNEFFVATIDRKTGSLTSILFHGKRGNRASQRLIYHDKNNGVASAMICDTLESEASSNLSGTIKTTGRIVVGEETVAHYTQIFSLSRGKKVLELKIDIQPIIDIGNSRTRYFGHRLAWRDEACKIFGSDQFVRSEIYAPKIQSPNFVEIENLDYTLTLLPNGLPYHDRTDRRRLDTMLIVGNEKRRSFRIGLGLDLKYPLKSAIDFACPPLMTKLAGVQPQQMFHLDSRNILVTHVRPCFSDSANALTLEMRLQETQRRSGEVTLFTPFKMAEIYRTNFHGDPVETLHNTDAAPVSQIKLSYAAADFFQIRIVVLNEANV